MVFNDEWVIDHQCHSVIFLLVASASNKAFSYVALSSKCTSPGNLAAPNSYEHLGVWLGLITKSQKTF